jgi:predicted ester cyclase
MSFDIEALLDLWQRPWQPGPEAEAAFRRFYTDPVMINGTRAGAGVLVERAVGLNAALVDQRREVLQVSESADAVAVAFRLMGRHVGPLTTSAGVLAPTGRSITLRVIDILTLTDGRVSAIWMVADELGGLAAIDAVSLTQP